MLQQENKVLKEEVAIRSSLEHSMDTHIKKIYEENSKMKYDTRTFTSEENFPRV